MLDKVTVEKLKERYSNIHPLIFHRSVERSRTAVELFDILDSFPEKYPVIWNDEEKCWITTPDLFQSMGVEI
jgi:hypothetical protein